MRESGITRFLTQKLSWNRFTQPEHHTFTWQGLDGSEVLTHFPPADTYNAEATVAELHREGATYKDHGRSRHSLMVFGHGDGGGGPTAEMLERLRRARDIAGLPRTTIRSPVEFFDLLEADASDLRTVVGELYFELHRGTYTSQAEVKRLNRRAEGALREAELLSALAGERRIRARSSPRCGRRCCSTSSTTSCRAARSPRSTSARARISPAWSRARTRSRAPCWASRSGPINLTPFARREVVGDALYAFPPYGPGEPVAGEVTVDGLVLANEHLRATLSPDGHGASLLCGGREALAAPANRLELYEDEPTHWEAWDIDPAHLETGQDLPPARSHRVEATARARRGRLRPRLDHPDGAARRRLAAALESTSR